MISIILPAHNEEENVEEVVTKVAEILSLNDEIVVVNDCSSDRTGEILKELSTKYKIKIVERRSSPNFALALIEGFKTSSGEILIPVMADLCDNLKGIEKMVKKIEEGFDICCASRYCKGGKVNAENKIKYRLSKTVGLLAYYLIDVPTHDITNSFKAYKRKSIEEITLESNSFDISMEITIKAHSKGYKITEIPTTWTKREKGKSKFKILKHAPNYIKWLLFGIWHRIGV